MIITYFTLSVRVIRENKSVTSLKGILRTFLFNSVACVLDTLLSFFIKKLRMRKVA